MSNALEIVRQDIFSPAVRNNFASSLSDSSIVFEKEAGFAMQAIRVNDYLCGIASKNRQSMVDAVTNIAAIGISLNPAKKQAYLVPRDGRVCLDISYIGLMDLAMATGAILWGQALIVREKDEFQLTGLDEKPHHKFDPFSKTRGAITGVYVVIKTHHGDYLTHTMPIDDVYAIRDRSSAWKAWKEKQKKCPWVTDDAEMIKKTCVKQAYKYWPKNARLETAIHHLNTAGDEGLAEVDMGHAQREMVDVENALIRIGMQTSQEDLHALWQELVADCRGKKDHRAYDDIKDAVKAHGEKLKEVVA